MDKENRNFDAENATRDRHGNITAKNQHGIDATGEPRKSARQAFLDADEKDTRVSKRKPLNQEWDHTVGGEKNT